MFGTMTTDDATAGESFVSAPSPTANIRRQWASERAAPEPPLLTGSAVVTVGCDAIDRPPLSKIVASFVCFSFSPCLPKSIEASVTVESSNFRSQSPSFLGDDTSSDCSNAVTPEDDPYSGKSAVTAAAAAVTAEAEDKDEDAAEAAVAAVSARMRAAAASAGGAEAKETKGRDPVRRAQRRRRPEASGTRHAARLRTASSSDDLSTTRH